MNLVEARAAYGSRAPAETPRDRLWSCLIVLSVVMLMLGAAGFFAYNELRNTQVNGIERGYKNRAASCALIAAQAPDDWPLPDICIEPEVVRYYDTGR